MDLERQFFSENGEWSHQEREFARRAVESIGLAAWHDLLRVQKTQGNEAFIRAIKEIWPGGTPPDELV